MLKNGENACDGAYSMNFLNDSELLDLGSAFNHYQSLGTCALVNPDLVGESCSVCHSVAM